MAKKPTFGQLEGVLQDQGQQPLINDAISTWRRIFLHNKHYIVPIFGISACILILLSTQNISETFNYHSVIKSLRETPREFIVRALLATLLSYLGLVGRDAVALRYMNISLPRPLLWIGAVAGSALGNAVGFGALTGAAVRYRVYGAAGIGAPQIARLSLLTNMTFALGLTAFGSLGLIWSTSIVGRMLHVPAWELRATGLTILAGMGILFALSNLNYVAIRLNKIGASIFQPKFLCLQFILIGIDILGAALALFVLMPSGSLDFGNFIAIYTIALLLGVVGHTPGGLGIFEGVIMFSLGSTLPPAATVAALLIYRAIYFILPLLLSGALLAAFEARGIVSNFAPRGLTALSPRVAQLVPMFLGTIGFLMGVMLLISSATPAFNSRLAVLATIVPLWVVESSQFLSSILGVLLLFAACGLLRRQDAAWWLAVLCAALGLVLALTKGLAFLEASMLTFLIVLLLATRRHFNNPTTLFQERFTLSWIISIGIVLTATFWVFFFTFRDVPYSEGLWWQFGLGSGASRALRATSGAALFAGIVALWQLLRPPSGRLTPPTPADLHLAKRIVRAQDRSSAVLAMMGDKNFVFSPSGRAFLMYAKRGRSWIALYDPVGPREDWPALIAQFVKLAHTHDGRAAFYQVRPDALPLYLEAGLKLMKLGEEACIGLDTFGIEGPLRANLRYALKRGQRDGLSAEVIDASGIPAVLPALREISDAWLQARHGRERSFSVAAFDSDYLKAQSVILARQAGKPVAFVTFMTTDLHDEATIGVMRHVEAASPYTMEYLFTTLALHLKQAGFHRLSLGMAPLSGLTPTPLAASWHRIAYLLWCFGGRLYNFRGLRTFKNKFHPEWQPRYLAASGVLGPFLALADITILTGNRS